MSTDEVEQDGANSPEPSTPIGESSTAVIKTKHCYFRDHSPRDCLSLNHVLIITSQPRRISRKHWREEMRREPQRRGWMAAPEKTHRQCVGSRKPGNVTGKFVPRVRSPLHAEQAAKASFRRTISHNDRGYACNNTACPGVGMCFLCRGKQCMGQARNRRLP